MLRLDRATDRGLYANVEPNFVMKFDLVRERGVRNKKSAQDELGRFA